MPNNRVVLHHCHSVAAVDIVRLAAAIQHFTNGSFPYVRIDAVATNAALSLSSVHHKHGTRESRHYSTCDFFRSVLGLILGELNFSDGHRLSENLTCEHLAQYKGVDLS